MLVYIANDRKDKNFVFSTKELRDEYVASQNEPFIISCEEVDKHTVPVFVKVWAREVVWRQRELEINVDVETAREMTDLEFKGSITNFGAVLRTEETGEAEYEISGIKEVDNDWLSDSLEGLNGVEDFKKAAVEARLRANERADLGGVNDFY